MAESTEITYEYLRKLRSEHIGPLLKKLQDENDNLRDFDQNNSPNRGIRAGNRELFGTAGDINDDVNGAVTKMREELTFLIKHFETISDGLGVSESAFRDTEDDSVLTAQDLAELIDPKNAGGLGALDPEEEK